MKNRSRSRKRTPWDNTERTQTQEYIHMHYVARYDDRHPKLKDDNEADMINSYVPKRCPYCDSENYIQKGFDSIGIKRYRCECGKYFKPTTGTIFDSRKIPISGTEMKEVFDTIHRVERILTVSQSFQLCRGVAYAFKIQLVDQLFVSFLFVMYQGGTGLNLVKRPLHFTS